MRRNNGRMVSFSSALSAGAMVLDGGLATRLEAAGQDLTGHLRSARLLADAPGAITAAHVDFVRAGARVATTATYQASFDGFASAGVPRSEVAGLLRRGVELADAARQEVDSAAQLFVAASVGPYGAALADGSEYTGDYGLDVAALRAFHRPRLEVLAEAGADVLALETIPCLAEVEALLLELERLGGVEAWLSLSCADGLTRHGEDPAQAWAMTRDVPQVVAVGINCTEPHEVGSLLPDTAEADRPVIVYPNSGEGWDAVTRSWTGDPSFHPDEVTGWLRAGVRAVGGCCRVGPAEIAAVAAVVRTAADGAASR
jgi:homocysteine S-methyltransferase